MATGGNGGRNRSPYFDRQGAPISFGEWSERHSRGDWRVAQDRLGEAWVSTIWNGIDAGPLDEPPVIFETVIFGGPYDRYEWGYSTEVEAKAGHERVVEALREGREP